MANAALSADWTPPAEVEEYRLVQLIGRGASGLVYLAQDTLLERLVALKFMLAIDADAIGRFLVEARATARLQHPNVLTLYRVGQLDDRPFLVSEFVRGTSLAQMAKPLPWREALKVATGIARGLAAAHRRGVLHRDIKPGNVMIGSAGEIKVLDFGLAKLDKIAVGPSQPPPPLPSPSPVIVMPQLTHQGLYFGTPFYMAPELWRREPATRRSDVYALGAVLYELCSGRTPLEGIAPADLPEAAQTRVPRSCASVCNEADATFAAFAAVIDRCLCRDPEQRFASAEELLDSLEQLSRAPVAAVAPKGNPYRGLQPFDSEHRALFFGRSAEIDAVVERLRGESFVLVVGDSGVGKSSLASAGVLPAVTDGALEDGRRWAALRLKPGRNPFATFVALLAPLLGGDEDALARELRAEPLALSRRLRRMLAADRGLAVFVDQLEELLTVAAPDEAEAFARILHELAGNIVGARLLATMRSDFLMRLVALPDFGDRISSALYLLRPPSRGGLCAAVVQPARVTGISFDSPMLIERLVESTARTEGGLPLLQFTLAQLWEARDQADGTISPETLESIGGLEGALARHADDVLDGMLPDERTAARRLLLQLVTVENTRAVRLREELATTAAAESALAALVRGRLVVVRDSERGATYEVAHEALISGWGTLKQWLSDELARRTAHERLEAAARQWDRLQRPEDALWSSKQRAQVELLDRRQLKPLETAFLEASQAAWRRTRRDRLVRALGAPLVLVALYGAFAVSARYGVRQKVQRYLEEAAAARASAHQRTGELSALKQRAFAAFDAADLVAGERDYARALALAGNVDDDYARGAEALENALVLDGGEHAVRRAIAELIDERARFDEDNRRPVRLRATLARLSLYDADIARRFVAPVRLRLTTTPPAELHLYSYDRADHYRREPVEVVGNRIDQSLAPGSYLIEAAAPGRASVREPLLLERGHDVTVQLLLPPAAAVPPGFVYIPEGTFLFGAAGDENMRREFYRTVPLHPRHTPAYLIARHETTWAEWIDFLEALPPAERVKRTPRLRAGGFHGSVALDRTPAGWHLRFVATTREYQAARGEKIVYESRATAQAQDWLRFPVSGIAWDDVVAYTRWLATSGRVPGARPCREDEWERAARGADGRAFPHGDELAPGDANWEATYGKQPLAFGPDEVGRHPASDSPYGLSDAAGNVWEWTQSVLKPGELVARGGSFYFATPSARSDNRESIEPTLRDITVGVRVCADPAR